MPRTKALTPAQKAAKTRAANKAARATVATPGTPVEGDLSSLFDAFFGSKTRVDDRRTAFKTLLDQLGWTTTVNIANPGVPAAPAMKEEYILWCPDAHQPPRQRFTTEERAFEIAGVMAARENGQFYVCKLVGFASAKPVTPAVTVVRASSSAAARQ